MRPAAYDRTQVMTWRNQEKSYQDLKGPQPRWMKSARG